MHVLLMLSQKCENVTLKTRILTESIFSHLILKDQTEHNLVFGIYKFRKQEPIQIKENCKSNQPEIY